MTPADRERPRVLLPIFILTGFVSFGVTMYFGDFLATGNTTPVRIAMAMFGILSGFVIAIFTFAGDPGRLYLGSWRTARAHSEQIKHILRRYGILLFVYLLTMLTAFATTVAQGIASGGVVAHWLERFTMSFCAAAFWWSLALPFAHVRGQLDRLDEEVRRREDIDTAIRLELLDKQDEEYALDPPPPDKSEAALESSR